MMKRLLIGIAAGYFIFWLLSDEFIWERLIKSLEEFTRQLYED